MSQTLEAPSDGCKDWPICQKVADLYNSGARLFTKEDLEDIEDQLRQSSTMKRFLVRRLDGNITRISNPYFRDQNPIWKPFVDYKGYWQLVKENSDGPTKTSLCPYTVDWIKKTNQTFLPQPMQVFDEKRLWWQNSKTCRHLTALIKDVLCGRTVKKVVCFGLGEFSRTLPQWLKDEFKSWDEEDDVRHATSSMIQHSMALTIAQLARASDNEMLPLLTQDPEYSKTTEDILIEKGFKIVGSHGAAGFAEVDDDSIVISAFPDAPIKQIIAELARPVVFITTDFSDFNDDG
ncbi:hypothetical protein N7493_007274 [Penicillium malachiteum]|uniref:SRR1-like domain-containing protein n=1 Tax=Penicillium malachiteum TaxID=1324776 RepID=A0AAD6MUS8_9EURO|nr:hypothetical protein N7493_007274 [Penicillium malachiteum]